MVLINLYGCAADLAFCNSINPFVVWDTLANSEDPDEMPHNMVFHQSTLLR